MMSGKSTLLWVVVLIATLGCGPLGNLVRKNPWLPTTEGIPWVAQPTPDSSYGSTLVSCMPSLHSLQTPEGNVLLSKEWQTLPVTVTLSNGVVMELSQEEDNGGLVIKNHLSSPEVPSLDQFVTNPTDGLLPTASLSAVSGDRTIIYGPFYFFVCGPTVFVDVNHAFEDIISPVRIEPLHSS